MAAGRSSACRYSAATSLSSNALSSPNTMHSLSVDASALLRSPAGSTAVLSMREPDTNVTSDWDAPQHVVIIRWVIKRSSLICCFKEVQVVHKLALRC